ncbi:MAG: hypothetical protein E6772_07905 [Dysgonomonas sp.]|nr:hypothetical protein [Dysgonomonas sp.]
MNKAILFSVFISVMGVACSSGQKQENVSDNATVTQQEEVVTPSDSGVVKIDMVYGKGTAEIRKREDQIIYLEFSSEGFSRLSAHLTSPDSLANIRFSQIFLPDGTMDGPFGRDIDYDLPSDGVYRLSVHENMMAGDPWGGVFKVDIVLLK